MSCGWQVARQRPFDQRDRLIVQTGVAVVLGRDHGRLDRTLDLVCGPPVAGQLRRRQRAIEQPRDGGVQHTLQRRRRGLQHAMADHVVPKAPLLEQAGCLSLGNRFGDGPGR